jgi:TetR/AcrR family transcriptional repressor of bet genes
MTTEEKASRTAPREVRRQQLIDATIESISQHGMSGTTMTTITQLANLSIGTVSFHFESKENLLVETLCSLAKEHRAVWRAAYGDAGLCPADKLWAFVEAHFHPNICTRPKLSVWFAFFGDAHYRHLYRERLAGIDAERWEETRRLCSVLKKEGGYDDINPMDIAKSLEGLYDGLWINLMMYPDTFSADDAKRQIRQFLARTFPRHFKDQKLHKLGAPA